MKVIRNIWSIAAEEYGTQYVLQNGVIPHIALLVGDERLADVFSNIEPPQCEIHLQDVGFFAARMVAYLKCHISNSLYEYHRTIYDLALSHGARVDDLYCPDRWIPHCTVAQECAKNLGTSIQYRPIIARVRSLIHITYPHTVLVSEKQIDVEQKDLIDIGNLLKLISP